MIARAMFGEENVWLSAVHYFTGEQLVGVDLSPKESIEFDPYANSRDSQLVQDHFRPYLHPNDTTWTAVIGDISVVGELKEAIADCALQSIVAKNKKVELCK